MAKNKKSFILYTDIKATVDKLSDEYAGKLFKHILAYVNDENPTTSDLLLEIAFEPVKQQFKRDLQKWEDIKSKRSDAGKASAEKRKQQKQQVLTHVNKRQQTSTNPTVNVNDNVSVNVSVNDNVINKEKNIKKEKLIYPFDTESFKNSIEIWKQYKQDQHRFRFKTLLSEQAFLKQISKDFNSELEVTEAIEYSMAQGYKGIFKPNKPQNNGSKNKEVHYNEELKRKLISNLSK